MRYLQVQIDGRDVTRFLSKKDVPRELSRSVKRTGFFSWQTQPVRFTLVDPERALTLRRNQPARVYVDTALKINGYLSKIENPDTDTPRITISPNILRLKDVTVGEIDEHGDRIFASDGYQTIRTLVNTVLADAGAQTGVTYPPATETDIPDECETPRIGLTGYLLRRVKRGPDVLKRLLINLVFGWNQDSTEPGAHLRRKNTTIYYIEEGAGFKSRLWIRKGSLFELSLKKTWKVAGVSFGFDFGTWSVPGHDWHIPTFKAYYHVFRCVAGQLEPVTNLSWDPIWPFNDPPPDLTAAYGPRWPGAGTYHITEKMLEDYASELGLTWYERIAWFDYDDQNSYALIYGRRMNELISDVYLIAFQTPFDNRFKVMYKNAKAIDIIKDLAVAGYRYLMMDAANRIRMPGRATIPETTTLPPERALKSIRETRKSVTGSAVSIRRYSEDSRGGVSTWGIVMSRKEEEALARFYTDLWSHKEEVQVTRTYYHELLPAPPPDLLTRVGEDVVIRVSEPLTNEGFLTIQTERLIDV